MTVPRRISIGRTIRVIVWLRVVVVIPIAWCWASMRDGDCITIIGILGLLHG
jgi:choline-glycine betaine transporter